MKYWKREVESLELGSVNIAGEEGWDGMLVKGRADRV
jgi:hypothetical protein